MKTTYQYLSKMHGFTLIELLCTLTIGLIIVAQLGAVLLQMHSNYATLNQQMRSGEGERFALMVLEHFIQQSAYVISDQHRLNEEFNTLFTGQNQTSMNDGYAQNTPTAVYARDNVSASSGAKRGSDVLFLRLQTPEHIHLRDCKNTLVEPQTHYQLDFYVDAHNDFRCRGMASSSGRRLSAVLATQISDMQLEFIYQAPGSRSEIKRCNARCISQAKMWPFVKAIRVRLKGLYSQPSAERCQAKEHCTPKSLNQWHLFAVDNFHAQIRTGSNDAAQQ